MKQYHIIVKGRVQGVNFRSFSCKIATELGLKGWARNREEDVEIIAQGEKQQLDKFLHKLRSGPPFARVDDIESEVEQPSKEFSEFFVRI